MTEITIASKRYWNYPEKWIQEWIPALTITSEYISAHEVWVALLDNQPVGYYSLNENEEANWLDNLWVHPEYMGQGIGRSLFQHAIGRCRLIGISLLKIEADLNAQSFYERMGAQKIDQHYTQIDGEPRILPILEIKP